MSDFFDTYNRRARVYPGAIVALPFTCLVAIIFISKPVWWSAILSIVTISGLSYLAAQAIRHRGRRGEVEMWTRWGGAPTTQALRYRGAVNRTLVDRRHRVVGRLIPDQLVPVEADETADPRAADEIYETLVSVLRSRTREGFPLLMNENCTYGFWRNLLAFRSIGLLAVALSLVGLSALWILNAHQVVTVPLPGLLVVGVVDVLLGLVFLTVVNESHVRDAGDRYAVQLFEAAESLPIPSA